MASDNVLPPQGTPGVFDARNPTLLPNFDRPVVPANDATDPNGTGQGSVALASPAGFLAANPRTDAAATVTVGGSASTGDILTIEAANPVFPNGFIAHTYTVLSGDTLDKIADKLADLFNDDNTAAGFGLRADTLGAVITFRESGPVGNFTALSAPTEEGSKITIGGTALTGDQITALFVGPSLPGGFVAVQQAVTTGQSANTIGGNLATAINANAALIAAGITALNTSGVVALTVPAGDEPIVVSSFVNSNPLTATIGGTITAGDVLTLIFTGAGIAGSPVSVPYTVLLGDTVNTIAAALAGLVNANAALQSAGIEASPASAVITFTLAPNLGQMRITDTAPGATETITITTAPTTTAVTASTATEILIFGAGSTPTTPASATALVGGTETDGDVISLVFTNAGVPGFPVTISHTAAGSESLPSIAAALNTAINANATLAAAGVTSTVNSATLTIQQLGAIGNSTVLSYTQGGNTETITFTPSNGHLGGGSGTTAGATMSGGAGPVLASNNFEFAMGNSQIQAFFYGQPYVLGFDVITAMVQQGMPIV